MSDFSTSPPAPGPGIATGRDAIIFIPGLAAGTGDQSVDGVCRRIAASLDRNARDGRAAFVLHEGRDEDYKAGHKTRIITIARQDASGEVPIADVYQLDYRDALTRAFHKRLPIAQGLSVAAMILLHWRAFYRSLRAKGKSLAHQAQLAYAGFLLVLLAMYLAMVIGTAVVTAADLTRGEPDARGSTAQEQVAQEPVAPVPEGEGVAEQDSEPSPDGRMLDLFQAGIVFLTFLGFLVPIDLKGILERVAGELTPVMGYLATGERRGVVLGQLADLLEHIVEKEKDPAVRYDRVHIVGYSFGSIVALDGLFQEIVPSERFGRIGTLVTIGCPLDFIRSYWPGYFQRRRGRAEALRWLNYYDPADVLASELRGDAPLPTPRGIGLADGGEQLPDASYRFGPEIDTRSYSLMEWATLVGFRVHAQYWERGEASDAGVFEPIVRELYKEQPALA